MKIDNIKKVRGVGLRGKFESTVGVVQNYIKTILSLNLDSLLTYVTSHPVEYSKNKNVSALQ